MTVRTRFAPSPTGRLHLGNVRTAVFNWLFARRHGGAFVLRIEDTDVERNVEGAEEALMEDLRWLGVDWDEGPDRGGPHGPYRQSERQERYRRAARELTAAGLAYPCFCSEEELTADSEDSGPEGVLRYSGRCRRLEAEERAALEAEGRPSTLRFAVPEDRDLIEIMDEIRGAITFPIRDIADFIILRADGRATYNFAVVVDDVDMEVSHVIRGDGHLSNTPRQALLFDALGRSRPAFAHLPTVLSPDGGKLSKREGAASLDRLREEGYHPDAVVNYLSLLGWSSPDEREVLSRSELVERISLDRVGASATTWDPDKLRWMSQQHLAAMPLDGLLEAVTPFVDPSAFPGLAEADLPLLLDTLRSRMEVLGETGRHLRDFCYPPEERLARARSEIRGDPGALRVVEAAHGALQEIEEWRPGPLKAVLRDVGEELAVKGRGLYHPLRKAVMGLESGPDLAAIMAGLGRRETLSRTGRVTEESQV